jgi:hypothetical protein
MAYFRCGGPARPFDERSSTVLRAAPSSVPPARGEPEQRDELDRLFLGEE